MNRTGTLFSATDNQSTAQTNKELKAAPSTGNSIFLCSVILSAVTAQTIKIVAGTTDMIEIIYLPANGTAVMHFDPPMKLADATNLNYTSTAAVAHSVTVSGYVGQS